MKSLIIISKGKLFKFIEFKKIKNIELCKILHISNIKKKLDWDLYLIIYIYNSYLFIEGRP